MNLKPTGDLLIVEIIEEETITSSGLLLPDTAQDKPSRGKVLAVGPGRRTREGQRIAMDVWEGDIVVFSKYGGAEIEDDGTTYLLLRESDVLGIEV